MDGSSSERGDIAISPDGNPRMVSTEEIRAGVTRRMLLGHDPGYPDGYVMTEVVYPDYPSFGVAAFFGPGPGRQATSGQVDHWKVDPDEYPLAANERENAIVFLARYYFVPIEVLEKQPDKVLRKLRRFCRGLSLDTATGNPAHGPALGEKPQRAYPVPASGQTFTISSYTATDYYDDQVDALAHAAQYAAEQAQIAEFARSAHLLFTGIARAAALMICDLDILCRGFHCSVSLEYSNARWDMREFSGGVMPASWHPVRLAVVRAEHSRRLRALTTASAERRRSAGVSVYCQTDADLDP